MKNDWKHRRETRLPQSPIGSTSKSQNTYVKQQRESVIVGPFPARESAGSSTAPKFNQKAAQMSQPSASSGVSPATGNSQKVDASEFFMI